MDDTKFYENLTVKKNVYFDEVYKALGIVKRFLLREKRILVGGQAIDYALKLKNHQGIYAEGTLPDYDVLTDTHFQDAYSLAEWLYRSGLRGISVINALHPSTMKVRINFIELIDFTYIPKKILEAIPTLWYKGYKIVHPHYQMLDQHLALSYPYDNAPMETIMHRLKKDMQRYDLIYEFYPLFKLNLTSDNIILQEGTVNNDLLQGQCISGFLALNYWLVEAKKLGFSCEENYGFIEFGDAIKYAIPIESYITVYSNKLVEFKTLLEQNSEEIKFYNRFLDKLPRKIIAGNKWEIFDNIRKLAAHKINGVYVANIQAVMHYILANYILIMKISGGKRPFAYYSAYLTCRKLIEWASQQKYNKKIQQFFPTWEIYGDKNLSDSYIVARHRFDVRNKKLDSKNNYRQPSHVYDRDLEKNKSVPRRYWDFDVTQSRIFNYDGEETGNFLEN